MTRLETHLHIVSAAGSGEDRGGIIDLAGGVVLVVAGGAGGTGGGELAAEFVVSAVREAVKSPDVYDLRYWTSLLLTLDQKVESDRNVGECTAVVAAVSNDFLVGASVGDSAAWLCRAGDVDDLTAAQVRKPLLGSGGAIPIPFERGMPDGVLLLGTDGLFKYTTVHRILEAVQDEDLASVSRRLVELVRLRSGALQDDLALALCRVPRVST